MIAMTNNPSSAFASIVIATHNYVDTATLVDAVRVHTADLTHAELVSIIAGFAGLAVGKTEALRLVAEEA